MAVAGTLAINVIARTAQATKGLRGVAGEVKGLQGVMGRAQGGVQAFLGPVAKIAAVAGVAFSGMELLKRGIALAADKETTTTSFKVLLGSLEQAKQLMGELQQFAASTPFQLPELQGAARSLLAFGFGADQVVESLRRIGDISAGIGAPIGEIAELYGKAKVQGRLFMEDINQLTGRGIPIIQELAKQFGVSEDAVRGLVEKGQVSFTNLETAFVSLTSEGGKFSGMMEEMSQTAAGKWSTLKDNFDQLLMQLGDALLPLLTDLIEKATQFLSTLNGSGALSAAISKYQAFTDTMIEFHRRAQELLGSLRWINPQFAILNNLFASMADKPADASKAFGGVPVDFSGFEMIVKAKEAETARRKANIAAVMAESDAYQASLAAEKKAADERQNTLNSQGEALRRSLMSPLEEINGKLADYDRLLEAGAINWQTHGQAVAAAKKEYLEAAKARKGLDAPQAIGAVTRNSMAGFSAVQESKRQQEAQLKIEQEQREILAEIRDGINRMGGDGLGGGGGGFALEIEEVRA